MQILNLVYPTNSFTNASISTYQVSTVWEMLPVQKITGAFKILHTLPSEMNANIRRIKISTLCCVVCALGQRYTVKPKYASGISAASLVEIE